MKKLITTVIMVVSIITVSVGQCTTLFSFAAYFNQVTFINQSTFSNAHYFWNFGDGTGSNLANPVHTFPGTGDYLVTLFAKDTINNCSSYYEYWVDVIKYSTEPCQPSIGDSIYTSLGNDYLDIYNTSVNCNLYSLYFAGADFAGFPPSWMPVNIGIGGWGPFHIVCIGQYVDNNNGKQTAAYKTAYYNYSSSHNYGGCSANFEFVTVSKDSSGERILFTAMNKSATFYKWQIAGFGNPIYSNNDTISQFYPYSDGLWIVQLVIKDSGGCSDSISQNILISDSTNTTLGIDDLKGKYGKVSVYPNPSNGIFTVDLSNISSPCNIEFYNVLGEKVYTEALPQNQANNTINLTGQPSGIYFYRVLKQNGELVGNGKLVIQN